MTSIILRTDYIGRQPILAFSGMFGRREITGILMIEGKTYFMLNLDVWKVYTYGVKEKHFIGHELYVRSFTFLQHIEGNILVCTIPYIAILLPYFLTTPRRVLLFWAKGLLETASLPHKLDELLPQESYTP